MNLQNPFRAEIGGVSDWINQALDAIMAKINAMWNIEHKATGAHGNVTCDTLTIADPTVTAAPTASTVVGNTAGSLIPTTSTQDLGAIITRANSSKSDHPWRAIRVSSGITFASFSDSGVILSPSILRSSSDMAFDVPFGKLTLTATSGVNTHTVVIGAGLNAFTTTNAINERGRTTAMGAWIAVAYASGNFTASAGAWTVQSGDQSIFRYMLIGTTMWVNFSIVTSSVSNAGVSLRIAIPGGFTCATGVQQFARVIDAGAASAVGLVTVAASGTFIEIFANVAAGGFAIATDTTYAIGTVCFEVS